MSNTERVEDTQSQSRREVVPEGIAHPSPLLHVLLGHLPLLCELKEKLGAGKNFPSLRLTQGGGVVPETSHLRAGANRCTGNYAIPKKRNVASLWLAPCMYFAESQQMRLDCSVLLPKVNCSLQPAWV